MNKQVQDRIVEAIVSGKGNEVLSVLYKETLSKVRQMVLKNNGNLEEANDIFQDAVLVFFKQVRNGSFKAEYDIDAYIYTIAKNLWIKRAMKITKNVPLEYLKETQTIAENALETVITEEKAEALETLMNKVGEECKKLLKLVAYEKRSMKEICVEMNYSSENVAKTYHYRCKKKFTKFIKTNSRLMELYKA
ncbi:MAG TPA: sigma-70 family RNA polymerase sigma factor [Cytophagaceae bacterium]|nr:sigma-70 family RNA polymerase sigma factor [Cytophagaceae bacterium]